MKVYSAVELETEFDIAFLGFRVMLGVDDGPGRFKQDLSKAKEPREVLEILRHYSLADKGVWRVNNPLRLPERYLDQAGICWTLDKAQIFANNLPES